jgi:hypothetical protein
MDFPQRHKILQRLAAQATGKNAGQPEVDPTQGIIEKITQALVQAGLPQDAVQQLIEQAMSGGQSGQPSQPPAQSQQNGTYPPQMTM